MSNLDQEDYDRIAVLIAAHLHEADEFQMRKQATPQARIRHWCHRCGLMVVVFGVGMGLHYFIESTHVYAIAQSAELSLAAMYSAVFERVKSMS